MMRRTTLACLAALALTSASANAAEKVTVEGEVIDTWCYYSGVMGGPDAVVGTAHHTCALWCAAGGIPVGLLAEDGTVYMILDYLGDDPATSDRLLDVQSHTLTVEGTAYSRDGLSYITIDSVVADAGIVNHTAEDYGPVPGFAIPELN